MIQELQLRLLPEQAASEQSIKQYVAREKGLDARTIKAVRTLKRSIDARQRTILVNLTVRLYINELPTDDEYTETYYPMVDEGPEVIVVGAGPGGLFAALRLIELGCRPIVVERGKDVHARKRDIARISREHAVDPESNYSFGEGGAGAYSDGKLYTRSKKRGNVEKILNVFCQHGASTTILSDAHPHIGTDKLPRVIENMRETIRRCGGEVHFETRMDRLIVEHNNIIGIETNTGRTFRGPVILATGHSARDVYRHLYASGIDIEAKGIAVGVRLEHPSELIDQIQYHNKNGRGKYLPAAEYSFVTQVDGRGVYSFCMCPGGLVVAAASESGGVVVNGMSMYNRDSGVANSALVVNVGAEDFGSNPLDGVEFQRKYEQLAYGAGGSNYHAPAQNFASFLKGSAPDVRSLVASTYRPGITPYDLTKVLPNYVCDTLRAGITDFGRKIAGYNDGGALLTGVETRTSAPVRIVRDKLTYVSETHLATRFLTYTKQIKQDI